MEYEQFRDALVRFAHLRQYVHEKVNQLIRFEFGVGHHKSYEGAMQLYFPSVFDDGSHYVVELHCYIVGNARHYEFGGNTLTEAVAWAEFEIRKMFEERIEEMYEEAEEYVMEEDYNG